MATEEQICERLPVWNALSELFLDTELSQEDFRRIGTVLANSRYTEKELCQILRHEVYPACSMNLLCVAGEWAAWGEDWIRDRIVPRYDHRPRFHLPAFLWGAIREPWAAVKTVMLEVRGTST